ncbi:calcium-transporting ATPase 8, plasma membrane-type-like [Humulus lupulus]|uniref:calcium-transporting ATPase 8, plasma membrane-type-like n=1 Tax=Humulus lupulus TaxID=3486 RepID=UPI002B412E70|nr:calcium-transporting ATPase 8, plasma membrane-type-like [Humulus lupulus]
MTRDHSLPTFQEYGGVKGVAELIKTNVEKGIDGDDEDLLKRRNAFGSNTYPRKKAGVFGCFCGRHNQVPADGILISGHSLAIDESSMTGERKIVHKDSKEPFLMSGCKVVDGSGTMLVTSVGINTEWGLLMASISEDTGEETPLQVRLNGVATFIGIVGLTVAFVVLVVLLVRYFAGHAKNVDGTSQFIGGVTKVGDAIDGAIKIVTVAVTIVVVAVPEGLPLAVTLTLACSVRKMMADKALVRRLSACETMGSAETICSDKTGTLTLNQMTVVEAYVGPEKIAPADNKSQLSPMLSLLFESIAQNANGGVFVPEGGGEVEVSGSPTEKAIISWGIQLGMNFEVVRSESTILHVFPFSSEKKRGGVAVKLPDSQVHVHWKGAAEIVLASCTQYIDESNQAVAMDEEKVLHFKKAIDGMAAKALRCVAIAYRTCELETVPTDEEQRSRWALPEDDLVLLAIVGIKDLYMQTFRNLFMQLLWVNLIMDTLGALALATEPPTDHLMHRPPVGRKEPVCVFSYYCSLGNVLRILRYLRGTIFQKLVFPSTSSLELRTYSDVDHSLDPTDRKSATGFCIFLGDSLISLKSKKQTVVSHSSTEPEYRAMSLTMKEIVWLRWLLADMGVVLSHSTPVYCDNQSAI